MHFKTYHSILCMLLFFAFACKEKREQSIDDKRIDPHSFSRPEVSRVRHLDLKLDINFEEKKIEGVACYRLDRNHGDELILDNMNLHIDSILLKKGDEVLPAQFQLAATDSILGTAIKIKLHEGTETVCIYYKTGDDATALQWLPKEQTRSKRFPFLFTQSQSIYARSWIPSPDGPGMRFTYDAEVKVPKGMMVVMSASNAQQKNDSGIYQFSMEHPVPAYLLALAAGDFDFMKIGERTGVYAEPGLLEKAAWEFEDLENMLIAAENLYGKYPWQRYDVIVLPASFPFGGMENPRMTFLTPSVIAGDQSLTALLAHELAHSWSGNLVTNASWNDFWLNEGFTTYFESRIMETIYGKEYADMLSILGLQDLKRTLDSMGRDNPLTKLKLELQHQDPEDALSDVAYEKGKALLRYLEIRLGRNQLDTFLRKYFDHFRFESNTSEGFLDFLHRELTANHPGVHDTVKLWIYQPGLIEFQLQYDDRRFKNIDAQLTTFLTTSNISSLHTTHWSTHEWIYFIRKLPLPGDPRICDLLEKHYQLSKRNLEIQCPWFEYLIRNGCGAARIAAIENYLYATGRRKFLKPIYTALAENNLKAEALRIFETAQTQYHPITLESIRELLQ